MHHIYENKSFFAFTHIRRNDTICIMKYSYFRRDNDEKNSEKMEEECIEAHQPLTCTCHCRRTRLDLLYCTLTACTLGQLCVEISKKKSRNRAKISPSNARNFFVHRGTLPMYIH